MKRNPKRGSRKNQTISIKELVSKMKKHSMMTVIGTAVLFAVICITLLGVLIPGQKVEAQGTGGFVTENEYRNGLDEIQKEIEALSKVISDGQNTMNEIIEQNKEISENSDKTKEQLESINTLEKSVTEIKSDFGSLKEQLTLVSNSVSELKTSIETNNTENNASTAESFASIKEELNKISTNYDNAQKELSQLITQLSADNKSDHQEILKKLENVKTEMSGENLSSFESILDAISKMESDYAAAISNGFSTVNGSIANMGGNITLQLDSMNTNSNNQFNQMYQTFGDDHANMYKLLDETRKDMNDKFDQVFQNVSRAKKLLASALFTKGVDIKEDATFKEYADAILTIPTELVIGVDKLPGTITYEYHFHKDGKGTEPGAEEVGVSEKGGCFNIPYYHSHEGNPYSNGGCYTKPVYHSHSSGCYRSFSYDAHTGDRRNYLFDANGEAFYNYYCSGCGSTFISVNGWHKHTESSLVCGKNGGYIDRYNTNCGMDTTTIISYRPDCGLVNHQIIGAHIVYDMNNSPNGAEPQLALMSFDDELAYSKSLSLEKEKSIYSDDEISRMLSDRKKKLEAAEWEKYEEAVENGDLEFTGSSIGSSKPSEKPLNKPLEKPLEKPVDKPEDKPLSKPDGGQDVSDENPGISDANPDSSGANSDNFGGNTEKPYENTDNAD